MTNDVKKIREQFIEQVGLIAQGEGLPRIAGRLMGLMVFDGEPSSFGDLAKKLKVSRGSISTNARMLESRGIIEKVAIPGDRQDYFLLAERPYEILLRDAAARSRKAQAVIGKTANELPVSKGGTIERVRAYEKFYATIAKSIEDTAEILAKEAT